MSRKSSQVVRTIGILLTVLILAGVTRTFAQPSDPYDLDSACQSSETTSLSLRDYALVSENEGWILIDQQLYWTHDGGWTWDEITPPDLVSPSVLAVSFLDSQRGWLVSAGVGDTGKIAYTLRRTQDGGSTWHTIPLALFAPNDPAALTAAMYWHWLDSHTGWLVVKRATGSNFDLGTLFKTTDGGITWVKLSMPIGAPVTFVNENVGWTTGGPATDELYYTQDGGLTWQPRVVDAQLILGDAAYAYHLPAFQDENDGKIPVLVRDMAGSVLRVYVTPDGGQTWNMSTAIPMDSDVTPDTPIPVSVRHSRVVLSTSTGFELVDIGVEAMRSEVSLPLSAGTVTELKMVTPQVGWAKHVNANLTSGSRETGLLRSEDGGRTWSALPLPVIDVSDSGTIPMVDSTGNSLNQVDGFQIFVGQGFDKCEIPTLGQLQTWVTSSPYRSVNLYIGGSCRACANTALTDTYLSQLTQQGWNFIPTWVGPQSAGYGGSCSSTISNDTATAYQQGVNEASAALSVAENLGLTSSGQSGTVIYYDLEGYTNTSANRSAAQSFISGWTARLRALGNKSGVYGSACASYLSDFASISHVPDAIWPGHWIYDTYNSSASVWDVLCISNGLWYNHQRIRQYAGGHNETWGGVTLNIDSNAIDGPVATTSDSSSTVVIVEDPAITPAYNGMCGSAWYRFANNRGHYAYLTLNTDQSAYSTNAASWQPVLPTAGVYRVEAYIPNHAPINWQCPSRYIDRDTSDARYTIYHANGRTTVSGDQLPLANQWLDLGNYTFNAGSGGWVELTDLNGETHISRSVSFSALRFTRIGDPPGNDGATVAEDPDIQPGYGGGMCDSAWYQFTNSRGHYAYLTLNTNDPAQSTNSAQWNTVLPYTGNYKVEALIANHGLIYWSCPSKTLSADTSDARYTIYHANGAQTVSRDQLPLADEWLDLGTYAFTGGTNAKVSLTDLNGEANLSRTVSFSAMRFTLQGKTADVTPPWGEIIKPTGSPIWFGGDFLTANAEDNPGGSGVKQTHFWVRCAISPLESSRWFDAGGDTSSSPYSVWWNPPSGLRSQLVEVGIHVEDNAGNYCVDPSPDHNYTCRDKFSKEVFFYKESNVTENWISADLRTYLNQRSLLNGGEKCSAASGAMVLAMNGKIAGDAATLGYTADNFYNQIPDGVPTASNVAWVFRNKYNLDMVDQEYSILNKDGLWSDVKDSIDQEKPVLLLSKQFSTPGHYVVIVGYREKSGEQEFIVYDPYGRWRGEQGLYDRNSEEFDSVKGRWVWYSLDDLWPSLSQWRDRKPYLVISNSVLLNNVIDAVMTDTPDSLPDLISLEEEDIGAYEGIPTYYQVFLPVIVR